MKKIIYSLLAILLTITGFAQQTIPLSQQEKDAILYMREEEKLARDVYDSMYIKWEVNPFGNIRQSEQIHMDRIRNLITIYKLIDPIANTNDKLGVFMNAALQKFYNEIVSSGSQSLTGALKAGAKIEELDIADLDQRIKQTNREDIITVYNYLKMASGNHLRAFVNRLKMQGVNYEPVILSISDFKKIIEVKNSGNRNRRY